MDGKAGARARRRCLDRSHSRSPNGGAFARRCSIRALTRLGLRCRRGLTIDKFAASRNSSTARPSRSVATAIHNGVQAMPASSRCGQCPTPSSRTAPRSPGTSRRIADRVKRGVRQGIVGPGAPAVAAHAESDRAVAARGQRFHLATPPAATTGMFDALLRPHHSRCQVSVASKESRRF